jgi:hypothetical protein
MDQHRPRKKEGPGLLDHRAPYLTCQDWLTIPKSPGVGKSPQQRAELVDPWLEARINYLAFEIRRLDGGSIARLFLKKARARYRQYRRYGSASQRYFCWSYLDQVAAQLVGCAVCSSNQLPSQEEAR